MGAYSPSGLINAELDKKIITEIVNPTFQAIKDMGENYKGFLYVGLMIKDNNPYLIEYNVRMGDPECQTILPLLATDLLDLILTKILSANPEISLSEHIFSIVDSCDSTWFNNFIS